MSDMNKKIANNILEFLIDPTVIPVRQRLYFGPGEKLQNEYYEGAKADAQVAYRDQSHNSDFYPQRNRSQSQREASVMDRKTIIASFDILSQQFAENDPIATDLRTMAYAVSQMGDNELEGRLAAKTFKCPTCGTKVLEQTGYCVKCKKKVKKAAEVCKACGMAMEACKCKDKAADQNSPHPQLSGAPAMPAAPVAPEAPAPAPEKEEEMEEDKTANLEWNRQASDAVRKALLEDVIADDMPEEPEATPAPVKEEEKKKAEDMPPAPAPAAPAPAAPAPEKEEEKKKKEKEAAKAKEEEELKKKKEKDAAAEKEEEEKKKKKAEDMPPAPAPAAPAPAPAAEPKKEEKKEDVEAKVVDTNMLATAGVFADIELTNPMIMAEDLGELSSEEQARLNSVLAKDFNLSADDKAKLDGLFK